jgi:AraC-like DNA-binding protein
MIVTFTPFEPDAAAFLSEETGIDFLHTEFDQRWFCVTARRDDGTLMGVAAFEFKEWFNAHFSTAICDQRCMSRKLLATMFRAVFSQAVRITALIDPGNQTAIEQTRRMGFVYEGFLRMGVEGRRDALIFGMLREDCRFLPGYHPARASVPPLALGGFHHGLQS